MSSKETREPKEPKHRPEALRLPQRKDSLTQVLTYLQGRTIPPRPASTASSTSTQSAPASLVQGLSRPRRHSTSHGPDAKKKARKNSTASKRLSLSNLVGILEESGTKTKHAKTPDGTPGTPGTPDQPGTPKNATKSSSSEKVNKTNRSKPQTQAAGSGQEPKSPSSPPPMPKSILRVASPDGTRPPPRHIRSYSTSAASPGSGDFAAVTGLTPLTPTDPSFASPEQDGSGTVSQPTSPVFRPLSPGATVRFAKATIHRVDVGPGRRFMPVKRRSKSTTTYISPLDPVQQSNTPRFTLQSPTKLRRHQENQAAMGRYWLRTEQEEQESRALLEKQAAEEAERYRAEPASPVNIPARPAWAERLTVLDRLPPLDSIPLLDKTEALARSDADDKLETVVASDSDDSDADSDGGASTAMDKDDEIVTTEAKKTVEDNKLSEPDNGVAVNPSNPAVSSAAECQLTEAPGSTASATPNDTPADTTNTTQLQQTEPLKAAPAAGNPAAAKPESEMAQGFTATTASPALIPALAPDAAATAPEGTPKPELTKAETPQAQAPAASKPTPTSTSPSRNTTTTTTPTIPARPLRLRNQSSQSQPPTVPERPISRPSSPSLKHKKSMASLNLNAASGPSPGSNHLHLSGRRARTRPYLGEHNKHEIVA